MLHFKALATINIVSFWNALFNYSYWLCNHPYADVDGSDSITFLQILKEDSLIKHGVQWSSLCYVLTAPRHLWGDTDQGDGEPLRGRPEEDLGGIQGHVRCQPTGGHTGKLKYQWSAQTFTSTKCSHIQCSNKWQHSISADHIFVSVSQKETKGHYRDILLGLCGPHWNSVGTTLSEIEAGLSARCYWNITLFKIVMTNMTNILLTWCYPTNNNNQSITLF